MISAVVLAAGMSKRLGEPKQLLPIENRVMIEVVIEKLLQVEIDEIIVVLGHRAAEIKEVLAEKEVKIIYNPDYYLGQSTSLHSGLQAVSIKADGILCMLGDLPLIKASTLDYLIAEFRQGDELIILPEYNGHRGNPVIFDHRLRTKMLEVSGDQGARQLLANYREQSKRVTVEDEGVIFDIDTKDEYQKLVNKLQQT